MITAWCSFWGAPFLHALLCYPSRCSQTPHPPPPQAVVAHHNKTNATIHQLPGITNGVSNDANTRSGSDDTVYLRLKKTETLSGPGANEVEQFGYAIAIYGNYSIFGAPRNPGTAYLFRTPDGGTSWDFVCKLVWPDALHKFDDKRSTYPSRYGAAVAMDSNFIVVGAKTDSEAAWEAGSVYIYSTNFENATNPFVQKLIAHDATDGMHFGASVAIEGNYIAIGAPSVRLQLTSSVYIYRKADDGANWIFVQKIWPPDDAAYSDFRLSTIDTNRIFISAKKEEAHAGNSLVCIYYKTADRESWVLTEIIAVYAGQSDFGSNLAVQGDVIAIGTPLPAAYIYVRSNGSWKHTQTIVPFHETKNNGLAVAMSADTMVIGTSIPHCGNYKAQRLIFVYSTTNRGATWNFQQEIDRVEFGTPKFGPKIAVDGNIVAISDTDDMGKGDWAGQAHMFRLFRCSNFTVSDGESA